MIFNKNQESIELVADFLKQGKICILPTDTVYGFSGIVEYSSEHFSTDSKIFKIKGRNESKPLIQLISSPEDIEKYSDCKIPTVLKSKWPGALTIIVPVKSSFAIKTPKIAFRCPGDEWLRSVIKACGFPIYSTSVNRTGKPVLDEIESIKAEFSKDVDLIVEDGDKKGSKSSTIVELDDEKYKIIRQGEVIV